MSLEVYTGLIKDLVITNPTPTDPKSQGDDHLRGIKKTMVEDCMRVSTAGFCKNKLFNGEVTRINQRNFDGDWANPAKPSWSSGNTIAQQEATYGYDMWAKQDGANMLQVIEAGNFRPSTVHTISGIGVTTRQETSPASGNWVIGNIPYAARNIQVEEGTVATPFEIRPISFELAQCQRYFEPGNFFSTGYVNTGADQALESVRFSVVKRTVPAMALGSAVTYNNCSNLSFPALYTSDDKALVTVTGIAAQAAYAFGIFSASAVI